MFLQNCSRPFLEQLILGKSMFMVLRPGFEPGSVAREATILNRTILPEPELCYSLHLHLVNIGTMLNRVYLSRYCSVLALDSSVTTLRKKALSDVPLILPKIANTAHVTAIRGGQYQSSYTAQPAHYVHRYLSSHLTFIVLASRLKSSSLIHSVFRYKQIFLSLKPSLLASSTAWR